jgi:hypothetical protein
MELLLPLKRSNLHGSCATACPTYSPSAEPLPLFTLVTILTIAIGVGANSAIFSVVNDVLLKPLPYPEQETLVALWETAPNIGLKQVGLSPSDYFVFREQIGPFRIWGFGAEVP